MTRTNQTPIDYDAIRERMKANPTDGAWRSLEELMNPEEFRERMKSEFPAGEQRWVDPFARRSFLKIMGASLAMSGLAGCGLRFTKPKEHILPYTNQPQTMVLGKPLFFASAMTYNGYGYPVLVESHEGRPTKIEGNPEHPCSLGGTLSWTQASVLDMYDPDRSQTVTYLGEMRNWEDFVAELGSKLAAEGNGGAGIRILTETITSPVLVNLIGDVLKKYPHAKWIQYDPAGHHNVRMGARLAFGRYVNTLHKMDQARVVVGLDADFTVEGPHAVANAKGFAKVRRVRKSAEDPGRYYAVESAPTCTGTLADHRLMLKPTLVEAFARAVAAGLGISGAGEVSPALAKNKAFVDAVIEDLKANKGKAVVMVGDDQPPTVHSLVHAINAAIGAVGPIVTYIEPVEPRPVDQLAEMKSLVDDMNANKVSVLAIFGGNPSYNAPADLKFEEALKKVKWRFHQSEYDDETSLWCQWHIPAPHYLESWGDVRSADGTVTIVQPLIAPLYNSRQWHETLCVMATGSSKSAYDLVQDFYKKKVGETAFEKYWRRAVHDGFIANSASRPVNVTAKTDASAFPKTNGVGGDIEIAIRPDPGVQDGRFANNAWLQELPNPFSKICWDNIGLISMSLAKKLGVRQNDVLKVTVNNATVEVPVFIVMGHAPDCITLTLGYGRTRSGRVAMVDTSGTILTPRGAQIGVPAKAGTGIRGYNAYKIVNTSAQRLGLPGRAEKIPGRYYKLSGTQLHFSLDDNAVHPEKDVPIIGKFIQAPARGENVQMGQRGLVRRGTVEGFRKYEVEYAEEKKHPKKLKPGMQKDEENPLEENYATKLGGPEVPAQKMTLFNNYWKYDDGYKWGMVIDTAVCTGCNACVVACQSENNIPVVGKEEVWRQHEMHWLRIDQYYTGDIDAPTITNTPLPCMHCEEAPCEVVCPVNATTTSSEGLNEMVYNRCVGTRFCSNNCPYKVRRFNWFFYQERTYASPLAKMMQNPEVTVRTRGVMEKCSYCVQRIASARIEAENENRKIRDGDIVTACQATCPTDAIVFGDINDKNSKVRKLKESTLNFFLLSDLNTRPRTSYMAVINNPNPKIKEA